jgi:serine protease Do
MMKPSMSRSPAPLFVLVGLALAASAAPLVAQKGETIARGAPRASASDSSGIRLRRLERTIDSLKRTYDDEELSPERRFKLRQLIDERFAEYTAVLMAASPRKSERNVYIRRAPDVMFESRFGDGGVTLPRIAQEAVVPGWIGIVVGDAPTQIWVENKEMFMRYLLYPQILSVDPASPAQRAGLAPGDTLMAYNGRDVRTEEISMTRLLVPKSTVKVRVRRDGKVRDLPVVVADVPARIRQRRLEEMRVSGERWAEMPPLPPRAPGAMTPPARVSPSAPWGYEGTPVVAPLPAAPVFSFNGLVGAQFVTLSEPMKRNLGLPSGVLVTTVSLGSPAAQSGLEEGDVILRVGQEPVATVRALRELVARAAGEGERAVTIDLRRGKDRRTLTLRWRPN